MDTPSTVTVAIIGGTTQNTARVLRSVPSIAVREMTASEGDLLAAISDGDIDAIAFTSATADLLPAIRQALMSGRHVLVAAPVALASKQLDALDDLARRRERVLVFDAGYYADERIAFVRRMTAGPNALWRPRYIRALRTGADNVTADDAAIAPIAIGEIEATLAILGAAPARVSAFAPRFDDESGTQDAVSMTLACDDGIVARIDVSLVEPEPRREIVVASDARTIVLDAYDSRAPLRIAASGRHRVERAGTHWAETISEHPAPAATPRDAMAAEAFITAVRARDVTASNARSFAIAALVFETARESIARWGEPVALPQIEPGITARPELRVIHGGGHRIESAAPDLRLVPQLRTASGGGGTPPDAA